MATSELAPNATSAECILARQRVRDAVRVYGLIESEETFAAVTEALDAAMGLSHDSGRMFEAQRVKVKVRAHVLYKVPVTAP